MKFYVEFPVCDFQFWGGAVDTVDTIKEHNLFDEFCQFIEEFYEESNGIPSETDVNDLVWFERDYIFDALGITDLN